MTATICEVDEFDGDPISTTAEGAPLPGGCLAWRRLGVGQRCETWLAWSPVQWCPVVVKYPRPHQLDHPRARRSLAREVHALHADPHPGLPALYTDGTNEPVPYVVTEHVDGPDLLAALDDNGPFAPVEVALLGVHLLSAVHAVHRRGVVHVDIKPDNVILRDGRPVLIDLGSARTVGAPQPAGRPVGSPGYAAPELEACLPIDPATDVFGVGVTLYEALYGRPAFDPDLPAEQRATVTPTGEPVDATVVSLLETDPARRPDLPTALRRFATVAAAAGQSVVPEWATLR